MYVLYNQIMKTASIIAALLLIVSGAIVLVNAFNTDNPGLVGNSEVPTSPISTRSTNREPSTYGPTVSLDGYHATALKEYPDGNLHQCDALVVTGGDRDLIQELRTLAEEGNTINTLDDAGRLRLTIDASADQELLAAIRQSSIADMITINVARKKPQGKEGRVCEGLVTVLGVEIE